MSQGGPDKILRDSGDHSCSTELDSYSARLWLEIACCVDNRAPAGGRDCPRASPLAAKAPPTSRPWPPPEAGASVPPIPACGGTLLGRVPSEQTGTVTGQFMPVHSDRDTRHRPPGEPTSRRAASSRRGGPFGSWAEFGLSIGRRGRYLEYVPVADFGSASSAAGPPAGSLGFRNGDIHIAAR